MNLFGKDLSQNELCIVAELSCNHAGKFEHLTALIDEAKKSGADAAKLQVYTADEMTLKGMKNDDFVVKQGPWEGRNLYDLYTRTQFNDGWLPDIFQYAKSINYPIFASVFSEYGLEKLEKVECPVYKIASFELTDVNFIYKVAKTAKPVILSTGMAMLSEIINATNMCIATNTALLHCISAYPTKFTDANLWRIRDLKNCFGLPIGFSDHTRGLIAGPAAVAAGAVILEKHLALRDVVTEDESFSLYPNEFRMYVTKSREYSRMLAHTIIPEEDYSRQFRRSLYVVKEINKGEQFTDDHVRAIRPSYGMEPYKLKNVLTKKASRYIRVGEALTEDMLQ